MRPIQSLLFFFALLLTLATAKASTIVYAARGPSRVLDSASSFLPDGSLVQLGKFNAGFDPVANASNLSLLKANFVVLDTSATFTESGIRVGTINDLLVQTGLVGTKLYVWIYNGPSVAASTQHGLFTESTWIAPSDEPPLDTLSITFSSINLLAVYGTTSTSAKLAAITPTASYATWAGTYFNPTQLANSAISGDDASPAGDGVSNLLKYAFGLPPLSPIPGSARPLQAVVPVTGSNYVGITFRRNRSAPDLTFEVQFSSITGSWPIGASPSQTVSTVDIGDGSDLITIRDTTPFTAGQPARLARLKVTRN